MTKFTVMVAATLEGGNTTPPQSHTRNLLQGALDQVDQAGSIQAIAENLQSSGLGDFASSRIGTGQNKPINVEQLAGVLGQDRIAALSRQAGIPEKQEAGGGADFSDVQSSGSSVVINESSNALEAETYTEASGDTLSIIAQRVYGDANVLPRIFDANNDLLDKPNWIFPGQALRIP